MDAPHEKWITEALALAERGRGWVSPNPMVGAVVVRDGVAVGRGWHQQFGGPHAEIFALREAGETARGATLYCTLEPCNHFGKTPPCTRAIIEAGITRVVMGAQDENPEVRGGAEVLRVAGVEVIEEICERACQHINAAFFKFVNEGLPFVTLKWAMSLDGRIATRTGDSKWITGEGARAAAHKMRARHDAVLAGVGTVMTDNPSLNARLESPEATAAVKQPRRIVLDPAAKMRLDGNIWSAAPAGPLTIVVDQPLDDAARERIDALRKKGAEVIEVAREPHTRAPLKDVLREIGKLGVLSVFVEGGAHTHGQMIDAKLADRVCVFIAPKIVGGAQARGAVDGLGIASMTDAVKMLGFVNMRRTEEDVLIEGALSEWGAV